MELAHKQHGEINAADIQRVRNQNIAKRVTHIIDCEGYSTPHTKVFLREVSVWFRKSDVVETYHIYMPNRKLFNPHHKCVRYQILHVHGLPIVRQADGRDVGLVGKYYLYDEVVCKLRQIFAAAGIIGYKGGTIERDLLCGLGYNCINLELMECPRYETLLTKYDCEQSSCGKHLGKYKYHCSGHEVKLFGHYLEGYG